MVLSAIFMKLSTKIIKIKDQNPTKFHKFFPYCFGQLRYMKQNIILSYESHDFNSNLILIQTHGPIIKS